MMSSMSSTTRPSRKVFAILAVLLLFLTMVGVTISTTQVIMVGSAPPAPGLLTVDERTYYEFVAPRLDRLVDEVDEVVEMVNRKSRDLIALSLSQERIQTLTDEIITFANENGIPERFQSAHTEIVEGTTTLAGTFGEAKSVLRRLNFSKMSTLIERFNIAAEELHSAQEHLHGVAGSHDAKPSDMRGNIT